jgi:hypothetical protein
MILISSVSACAAQFIVYEADWGWVKRLTSKEAKGCHVMVQVWAGKLVS